MNVAFFLTPKSEVIWVPDTATLRQAIERIEADRFAAIPILDAQGHYAGTLTEGDVLWALWHADGVTREAAQHLSLRQLARHAKYQSVSIDAQVEELLTLAAQQNFVPVADSRGAFIGIVRRKSIIEHCAKLMRTPATR
ncbi:MAG: CBS domain-containing protein [Archangium gephyra]|uniref:CBS domain-containing protein n=1 Tax=Archangium gephyra TaxID=48 RepID=A0A2W5SZE8_9BACT|nr:MAG: CBS domain-containing protein [Archangium gephyra]